MVAEMYRPCPTLRKISVQHLKTVATKIGNISRHAIRVDTHLARERALKFFSLIRGYSFKNHCATEVMGATCNGCMMHDLN